MRTDTYRDPWTVLVDPRFPEAVSRTKKAKNGEKRGWASIGMFEKQKKRKTSVVWKCAFLKPKKWKRGEKVTPQKKQNFE